MDVRYSNIGPKENQCSESQPLLTQIKITYIFLKEGGCKRTEHYVRTAEERGTYTFQIQRLMLTF